MQKREPQPETIVSMLADYMEDGFLENIIAMFRKEPELCAHIATLIQDDRVRVRIGITALTEELRYADAITRAAPGLIPLLRHEDARVRGDAANLLAIIAAPWTRPDLDALTHDPNPDVRLIAQEALRDLDARDRGK